MTTQATDYRSEAFRAIAAVIDTIESTESTVREVTLASEKAFSGETLGVQFEVTLPEISNIARMGLKPKGEDLRVADDGTCILEFTLNIPLDDSFRSSARDGQTFSALPGSFDIADQFAESDPFSLGDESPPETSLDEQVPAEVSSTTEEPASGSGRAASSETEPPPEKAYRDPEQLQAVYDEYQTFEEMRDALGVDVTPQTVRRHMIKHGIHEVSSNPILEALRNHSSAPGDRPRRTDHQGEDEFDQLEGPRSTGDSSLEATDLKQYGTVAEYEQFELPKELSIEDIKDAVLASRTVYEAQQHIDLTREETRNILRDLDLLELVVGRVASSDIRDFSEAEVETRILNALGANESIS